MPNWCDNTIHITGDAALHDLWEIIRPDDESVDSTDLTKAFPIPEGVDWYSWCSENWGTKWAPEFDGIVLSGDGEILLFGDSAWSPPVALLRNVSRKFPTLTFSITYAELGCDFVGAARIKNGMVNEVTRHISSFTPLHWNVEDEDYFDKVNELVSEVKEDLLNDIPSFAPTKKEVRQ